MDNVGQHFTALLRIHWSSAPAAAETSGRPPRRWPEPSAVAAVGLAAMGGLLAAGITAALGNLAAHTAHPEPPPTWPWAAPFVLMLLLLAIVPWRFPRIWQWAGFPASAGLALLVVMAYGWRYRTIAPVAQSGESYLQFMTAIAAFYCVCANLKISLRLAPTPLLNTAILAMAALSANLVGTCGATVIFIVPFLELNRGRISGYHIYFFVAIAANIGGLLTPMGDPPLMAGYLYGVPFWWMLLHAWPMWCVGMAWLLGIFYFLERRALPQRPAPIPAASGGPAVEISHAWLILPLAGAVAALFLPVLWRTGVLAAIAIFAILATQRSAADGGSGKKHLRKAYSPLLEMASLFLGIFITMTPVLAMLEHIPPRDAARLQTPAAYYLAVGAASSVLDNTPTYIAGLQMRTAIIRTSTSRTVLAMPSQRVAAMAADKRESVYLLAIAMGAVMFGAMTWIGNGPNLLVQMVCRQRGVPVPAFGGFVLFYAVPILLPLLAGTAFWFWLLFH